MNAYEISHFPGPFSNTTNHDKVSASFWVDVKKDDCRAKARRGLWSSWVFIFVFGYFSPKQNTYARMAHFLLFYTVISLFFPWEGTISDCICSYNCSYIHIFTFFFIQTTWVCTLNWELRKSKPCKHPSPTLVITLNPQYSSTCPIRLLLPPPQPKSHFWIL